MRTWPAQLTRALPIAALLIVGVVAPVDAQEQAAPTGVRLLTPYVGVAVEPGDTTSFNLEVQAPSGEVVALNLAEVPEGWDARIRGGGFVVDRVLFDEAGLYDYARVENKTIKVEDPASEAAVA